MPSLSLTLFGGFDARAAGGAPLPFATDKARALLAYLALRPNRPLRREALAGLLWPEQSEAQARQNLRQTLSRLRRSLEAGEDGLGDALLTVTRSVVELDGAHVQADAVQFQEHLAAVEAHRHSALAECPACLVRLETAAALHRRGDFMAGLSLPDAVPFEEWLRDERQALHRQQLALLEQLTTAHARQRAYDVAHRFALWQIEIEPWREESHRQVMRLLAQQGERGAALAQYERCRQILETELGVEPAPETTALWREIKEGGWQPSLTGRTQTHHFPAPLTPFIGRAAELGQILAALGDPDCRAISLIGPGGMGKTRLAMRVGEVLAQGGDGQGGAPHYRDGAYFVGLSAVTNVDRLVTAAAGGLGLQLAEHVSPHKQLLSYLEEKQLLLVCDNFEQVAGGAALAAEIAATAPGVQLLITTQQPLNIQAERRFLVGGLALDAGDETAEAVQFFQRSARRVLPDFQLVEADLPVVLALCRLLDGMPLALEIAAGWVRMMDCRAILEETQKSLDFLVALWGDMPPRHQSVRAVLTRSWQLLPARLQKTLRQMAHFAGGFTLPAALAVIPGLSMGDVAALLDQSLISWQPNGRYQLHPLLRQFVQQQSEAAGDGADPFRQRYCRCYLGLLASQEAVLRGGQPLTAVETIRRDLDNVRQAWRWGLEDRLVGLLGEAVGGLGRFYHLAGLFEEGEQQMTAALGVVTTWEAAPLRIQLGLQASHFLGQGGQYQEALRLAREACALGEKEGAADLQAQAYSLEGEWRRHLNELDGARRCLDRAAALFTQPDRSRGFAHALEEIGRIHLTQSRFDEALVAFNQARQIYAALDDRTEMALALGDLAEVYRLQADYERALACSQEALAVAEAAGYRQGIVKSSLALGAVQIDRGDLELARATYEQVWRTARELGYLQGIVLGLIGLGSVCVAQGRLEEGESWLQAALRQAEAAGLQDLTARALGRQGIIYAHRGQHEAAIAAYQQAAQLWRLLNNQTELSLNLGNLGNIYLRQGIYDRALTYYERALASVQSVGARQVAANIMVRLGNIYKRVGDYERAVAYFKQSLATYEVLRHKSGMAVSLGWLGVMQSEMGRYEPAQAFYEQAQALTEEIGDHISTAIWLMNRAEAALHLGQRQGAEELAAAAVALSRTLGSTRYLPGALIHQAEILLAHGQLEEARLALQEALALPAAANDQQLQFDGRLFYARLLARSGEEEEAAGRLRQMLVDFTSEAHQAQLYFDLWQLTGEGSAWERAVRLHEEQLHHTPLNHRLLRQLEALKQKPHD